MYLLDTLDKKLCTELKGVGKKIAGRLGNIGIKSVQDLLFHLPLHYQDRTRTFPIDSLQADQKVLIEGEIQSASVIFAKRRMLTVKVSDGTGVITLCFFYFNSGQQFQLSKEGSRIRCFGEVKFGHYGCEMFHPEYRIIGPGSEELIEQTLTPIYPTTEGVSQKQWRKMINQSLAELESLADTTPQIQEWLPLPVRQEFDLWQLHEALKYVHKPPKDAEINLLEDCSHAAQQRLAFEELLAHQLSFFKLRQMMHAEKSPQFVEGKKFIEAFIVNLPFELTSAQLRVWDEITEDLKSDNAMLRLLQGDVGSGKTIIALLSMLNAVSNGYQAVLMAPTEILAEQHFKNIQNFFVDPAVKPRDDSTSALWDDSASASRDDSGGELSFHDKNELSSRGMTAGSTNITVDILTGSHKGKSRQEKLDKILSGETKIIIGTHSLFQEDVNYLNLGLLVVDEQHRFGVHQRLMLREKGAVNGFHPHQLIMTATPIPRTLAMTAYADLDYSVIDELPPGRQEITTSVLSNQRRDEIINRVFENCKQGKQAYWVCPLVDDSESLQCQAAESTAALLKGRLPELKIGLIHGRMKPVEKDEAMQKFSNGEIDLLVATTVIEVGVDVPNASLMIIENPERLGLAQIHQLRGRVGRGSIASHCVLMYQPPLTELAKQRLAVLRDSNDGFLIAQKDMEIRGAGEVLGTRQAGIMKFKIADILRDHDLIPEVQKVAKVILSDYPSHIDPLIERWTINNAEYGKV